MSAPEPLVPPDCDCRGLPFMPLEVARFTESDFTAISTGDEFKAAVILWAKSWSQVPAASLPDDDRILARMTGYTLAEWQKLREMALHNWIKCADGRLYHPVIADLAVAAAEKRKGQSERANSRWAKARAAKAASATAHANGMPPHTNSDATVSTADAVASAPAMQGTVEVEGIEPPIVPQGDGRPDEVQIAFDAWNEMAARCGLPKAKFLDEPRRRAIRKRLESGGLETWRQAVAAVEASAFLRGQRPGSDGRIFRADLTFACQAKSFTKLIEGAYGEDAAPAELPPSPDQPPEIPWRRRMMAFSLNAYWEREWGPKPGEEGCLAPPDALAESGVAIQQVKGERHEAH